MYRHGYGSYKVIMFPQWRTLLWTSKDFEKLLFSEFYFISFRQLAYWTNATNRLYLSLQGISHVPFTTRDKLTTGAAIDKKRGGPNAFRITKPQPEAKRKPAWTKTGMSNLTRNALIWHSKFIKLLLQVNGGNLEYISSLFQLNTCPFTYHLKSLLKKKKNTHACGIWLSVEVALCILYLHIFLYPRITSDL